MESLLKSVLNDLGENPKREGLEKTPHRWAKALKEMTKGYAMDPHKILTSALFTEENDEMVTVKNIEFYSLCEHHVMPFFGKAHISYIPNGKIVGLSKLPRIVEVFARRLQVQERLTNQIADAIQEALQPQGVAVYMDALHMCMAMRGIQKQNCTTVTSSMRGAFRDNLATRKEFLDIIGS